MTTAHKRKTRTHRKNIKTELNISQLLPLLKMMNSEALLYDSSNNVVNTVVRDELKCGEYEICFDEEDFKPGEYNLKLKNGEEPESNQAGRLF
jgi:hypothetical protein